MDESTNRQDDKEKEEKEATKEDEEEDEKEQEQDREFMCLICFETIMNPVSTKCGHTFCEECFNRYIESKRHPTRRLLSVKCPNCRQLISASVPEINVMLRDALESKHPHMMRNRLSRVRQLGRLIRRESHRALYGTRRRLPHAIRDDPQMEAAAAAAAAAVEAGEAGEAQQPFRVRVWRPCTRRIRKCVVDYVSNRLHPWCLIVSIVLFVTIKIMHTPHLPHTWDPIQMLQHDQGEWFLHCATGNESISYHPNSGGNMSNINNNNNNNTLSIIIRNSRASDMRDCCQSWVPTRVWNVDQFVTHHHNHKNMHDLILMWYFPYFGILYQTNAEHDIWNALFNRLCDMGSGWLSWWWTILGFVLFPRTVVWMHLVTHVHHTHLLSTDTFLMLVYLQSALETDCLSWTTVCDMIRNGISLKKVATSVYHTWSAYTMQRHVMSRSSWLIGIQLICFLLVESILAPVFACSVDAAVQIVRICKALLA